MHTAGELSCSKPRAATPTVCYAGGIHNTLCHSFAAHALYPPHVRQRVGLPLMPPALHAAQLEVDVPITELLWPLESENKLHYVDEHILAHIPLRSVSH